MRKGPCDEALAHIYTYLDRELNWWRAMKIRRHIEACNRCTKAFDFETRLKLVVRERLREDVPPEFVERLRRALGAAEGGSG